MESKKFCDFAQNFLLSFCRAAEAGGTFPGKALSFQAVAEKFALFAKLASCLLRIWAVAARGPYI